MTLIVDISDDIRLDSYISAATELSRNAAVRAIEEGRVLVDGTLVTEKKRTLHGGEKIEITEDEPKEYEVLAENIPINVVFEDADIIVINKPSGMVVHPAPGNYSGTLVNALLYHCRDSLSGVGGVMRPGIVHRIDKDTSGLLVVAKNDFAHNALSEELKWHGIEREYHAIAKGGFRDDHGTVSAHIGRHPIDRKKMAVLPEGAAGAKDAVTHYEVLARYLGFTYLKLRLETGRTHQIRVHMSHIGHSLIGDELYGGAKTRFEKEHTALLDGQALHAKRLTLTHPRTKQRMSFECELPDNFKKLLKILESEV